jgi:hypothetical protein
VAEVPTPFVLICSNFSLTCSQFGSRESSLRSLVETYGLEEAFARRCQEEEDVAIREMGDCIEWLAERFPGVHFVYRPHPFERADLQQERFARYENISIRKQGDASPWILDAAAVIQLNCTTSYDAWFARTPSFKPGWIVQEGGMGNALAINHVCDSLETLAGNLEAALAKTYDKGLLDSERNLKLIQRFFGEADGRAHVRVADHILRVADLPARGKRLTKLARVKESAAKRAKPGPARWAAKAFASLGFQSTWNLGNLKERRNLLRRYTESQKYFDADTVRHWATHLAAAAGRPAPVVDWASDLGEYPFGGRHGKAVLVGPQS